MTGARKGAYGLSLGAPVDPTYLVDAPDDWPHWELAWQLRPAEEAEPQHLGPSSALVNVLPAGQVRIDRHASRSTFLLPQPPSPHAWVHPYLSSTAVVAARWAGQVSLHAGCFVLDGGAWGVIGERNAGKSSALAWLASQEVPVLCDDILVVDGDRALAGPRCLDLRRSAWEHFGLGTYIGVVGTRERWRAQLPPLAASYPLRGWVAPTWGDELGVTRMTGPERLKELMTHRGLRLPEADGGPWLGPLALPMYKLTRPTDWAQMDKAMTVLLDVLAG